MPLTPASKIRKKTLDILRVFIAFNDDDFSNDWAIREQLSGLNVPNRMVDLFFKLSKPPSPIIDIPLTKQNGIKTIQDIIDYVHAKENENQPVEHADSEPSGETGQPAEDVDEPDTDDGPDGPSIDSGSGSPLHVGRIELGLRGSSPRSTNEPGEVTLATSESIVSNRRTDFVSSLFERLKAKGWNGTELIAIWRHRCESLFISEISCSCDFCASWIGPEGHGIITFSETVPETDDDWSTWAKGKMIWQPENDQPETIIYLLSYNERQDAIRIRPAVANPADWNPKKHCSIVIAKTNGRRKVVAPIAEMTNKDNETIELTKREL